MVRIAAAAALSLAAAMMTGQGARERIRSLEKALPAAPDPGLVMYGMARDFASIGENAQALAWLEKAAALKLGFDPQADEAFAKLRGTDAFRRIAAQVEKENPALVRSTPAFRIAQPDLIPEGLAWDAEGKRLFLGSIHHRKIVEIAADGHARDFVTEARDGLGKVLGMKADRGTASLWAAANLDRESAVYRFDLRSGNLLGKYAITGEHLFNDLVVGSKGDVFVTDTHGATVYRIAAGAKAPEPLAKGLRLIAANGIALSADERRLYVSAFPDGISVVDIATGMSRPIARPAGVTLATIDGLYRYKDSLIAIQNGVVVNRVMRLHLTPAGDAIDRFEVLERRHPAYDIPTTGAVAGDAFYYIANTQLDKYGDGKIAEPGKLQPIVILKLSLFTAETQR